MAQKRQYNKKSNYWNEIKNKSTAIADKMPEVSFGFDNAEPLSSIAALGGGVSYRNGDGSNNNNVWDGTRYQNIDAGILPWEASSGRISMSRAIILCNKAYANIAIVRNTVEGAVEFSSSPIHFSCSNLAAKLFIETWAKRINLNSFINQYFREYYRSGNVFTYSFNGFISDKQFGKLVQKYKAKSKNIPIRYIILNPTQISLLGGVAYSNQVWTKILSTYEIERLRNRETAEEKQIFDSLPENIRKQIDSGAIGTNGIYMPLDASRLRTSFYKKQDYESMAIPMIFPILNDLEHKLELKKMDMQLSRTVEHVILLVTHGQKNDEYNKGGINPANIANLTSIFQNKALGRVLVADHTTKADWLIPDIAAILGPDKYKQVESDIREGLQSIFSSANEKFANAQIRAKVFIERMKEGQRAFLENFLEPEIKKICENMNFREIPKAEFEPVDLSDPSVMSRVYVQMAQLGLLTADEVTNAIKTGTLPEPETSKQNQEKYKEERDKGLFVPLIGGPQSNEKDQPKQGGAGRPMGTKAPQTTKQISPIGTGASVQFSMMKIGETMGLANRLKELVEAGLCKKFKIKKNGLTVEQKDVAETLTKNIISNESIEKWTNSISSYISDPKVIKKEIADEIDEIAYTFDVTDWEATILRHCKL